MSKYFSSKYSLLTPYVPGEQPKDMKYIKLNTNESPYPTHEEVQKAVESEAGKLNLYCDPECRDLIEKTAEVFGVEKNQVLPVNGSDEALNFAFMAFSDKNHPLIFPDITYGFYPVFANLNNIPYKEIPLNDDFTVNVNDYVNRTENIVIANPNAPTGIFMPLSDIEKIVSTSKGIVIVDEAYVDFGGESAIKLINKYENLLVVCTFSKSRSMAGARLGFAFGNKELISDLNTIRYSTNPYNVNRMTQTAGIEVLKNNGFYMENCRKIIKNRENTVRELKKLGFSVTDSCANFVFAKSDKISGSELYLTLKSKGILIRHFDKERIKNYNRITIGTDREMETFISEVKKILEEKTK